jgi:hypothetical protein
MNVKITNIDVEMECVFRKRFFLIFATIVWISVMRKTPLKFHGVFCAITHLDMTVTLLYVVKTNIHVVMDRVHQPMNCVKMVAIYFFVKIFFLIVRLITIIDQPTYPSSVGF